MSTRVRFGVDPKLTAILGESYTSSERALCELVDNAWDADAEKVTISLPAPLTDDPIVIDDDGTGMTPAEVKGIYLRIANDRLSRSKDSRTAGKLRIVKGRKGIGKFAGLAAASIMTLCTRARGTATEIRIRKNQLMVAGSEKDLEKVDLPIVTKTVDSTDHGTTVTLTGLDQNKQFPTPEKLKQLLVREYGRETSFKITVNGEPIAVADIGGECKQTTFEVPTVGNVTVSWTITDRPLPKGEAGLVFKVGGKVVGPPSFCGIDENPDIPSKIVSRIYGEIEADGLDKHVTADWMNIIENSLPHMIIKTQVRDKVTEHISKHCRNEISLSKARLEREYKAKIEKLPENRRQYASEAVERIIQKYFPEGDDKVKLLVGLMLDALSFDDYFKVCQSIAEASRGDIVLIADCLDQFGIVDIAVMGRQAKRRLEFLDSLEAMVRDHETLEAQVHQAFEHNLWILGPEYSLIASNKTLANILRDFCDKEFARRKSAERPDLFLGRSLRGPKLLIEFKRPSIAVGRVDEAQAKSYRDKLSASHGAIDVIVLGGSVDATMSNYYDESHLKFRSYMDVIAEARDTLRWVISPKEF